MIQPGNYNELFSEQGIAPGTGSGIVHETVDWDDITGRPETRSGTADIGSGVAFLAVTFSTALPSASYFFRALEVINTTDGSPLNIIPGLITAKTASGFTVQFNGETDSANYDLSYVCEMLS